MQGVGPTPNANDAGTTRHRCLKALECTRLEAAKAQERKGNKLGRAPGDRWPTASLKENSIFRPEAGAPLICKGRMASGKPGRGKAQGSNGARRGQTPGRIACKENPGAAVSAFDWP